MPEGKPTPAGSGPADPGYSYRRTWPAPCATGGGRDGVPDGYRAMDDRESIKVMVRP